jgi:GT2 family glycosyltransferase
MNLSVIIPNYNGEKLLSKNLPAVLESLSGYKSGRVELIITDDCSTDNSCTVIEMFIKGINNDNIVGKSVFSDDRAARGFANNINRGVSVATGEILILLNTDVVPNENFLDPLLIHFRDEEVFAVGCMDESYEKGEKVLRGRGLGRFHRGFLIHRRGEVDRRDTLWVSGGSGAFRKTIWDKLGGFSNLYNPFYWEDIDLSYVAQKSGYKVFFEKGSVVEHRHEEGAIKKKFKEDYIKKISYRNQFIFMWKNITDLSIIASHFLWLPHHFVKALWNKDWQFFGGFFLALMKSDKILKERRKTVKSFIKKDHDVI